MCDEISFFSDKSDRTQVPNKFVAITKTTDYDALLQNPKYAWLKTDLLVAKPDQLIKRSVETLLKKKRIKKICCKGGSNPKAFWFCFMFLH